MRASTKGLALALAVLIGATPLTSPLSAYATQVSDQVIVYDTAADDDTAAGDDAVSMDETNASAADDEAFSVDAETDDADAQSYATDDGTVQDYDASGQTVWTGDDANADRKDDETYVDSDAELSPNSWRYQDGVLTVSGGNEDDLIDAQSLSDNLPSGAVARGIDVSSYQGKIDWEKVKASGIKFAIIRIGAVYGSTDSYFERNVSECERLGIPYGIYYYTYARTSAEAQRDADRVISWLGSHRPQLPIYYDVEDKWITPPNISAETLNNNITIFCNQIKAAGFTPGVYTNLYWSRNFLTKWTLQTWDIWIAQYNYECNYTGSYSFWQYGSKGSVPGIEGNVDMDYAYNFKALTTTTKPTVYYQAHVSDVGWQPYTTGTAGTTGQSKAIEALNVTVINNPGGTIQGSAHVQDIGWQDYTSGVIGTTGQSKRIEAVKFKLTGTLASNYDVYYRVYSQDIGWLGWAKNGEEAGTQGYGYRAEAIEIKLVSKGGSAPGSTSNRFLKSDGSAIVTTQAHVSNIGWQDYTVSTAGTTGQSKAIEALNFSVANNPGGSVQCSAHVQDIGWQNYTTGTAGTTGKGKQIEAVKLKLTGTLAEKYDIYYRVHCQDFGWMGWAKNGEEAGSEGYGKRVEAIEVRLVTKGSAAPGSTSGRFNKKPASVSVQAHVSDIGWQAYTTGIAGTTGKSKAIEALNFQVSNSPGGTIQCSAHVQDLGWQGYTSGMAGTTGRSKRLEAIKIKLSGALAEQYDVYYRVHVQDFGWLGWAKNGESAGSEGYSKRAEAIEVRLVAKGGSAPGSTANAFKKK